jgi:hypothetical protein
MNHEDLVRMNVMKEAGVDGRFSWLAEYEQQELDAAIAIVRQGFQPELISGLSSLTELGVYLLSALETDHDRPREDIFYRLAETHVECSKSLDMSSYYQMLGATVKRFKDDKSDVRLFVHGLWAITVERLDASGVLKLIGVAPEITHNKIGTEIFAQGAILRFFTEMPGHKEFLIKHVPQHTLGKLVRKYELEGLEGAISRKDAGHLLSDRLGL